MRFPPPIICRQARSRYGFRFVMSPQVVQLRELGIHVGGQAGLAVDWRALRQQVFYSLSTHRIDGLGGLPGSWSNVLRLTCSPFAWIAGESDVACGNPGLPHHCPLSRRVDIHLVAGSQTHWKTGPRAAIRVSSACTVDQANPAPGSCGIVPQRVSQARRRHRVA